MFVLVGGIATYERKSGGQNGQAASEHDEIVGDVESNVDAFAAFRARLDLLIVHALRDPEAQAVDDETKNAREYVKDGVTTHELEAGPHATERVEEQGQRSGEHGQEHEGDHRAHD